VARTACLACFATCSWRISGGWTAPAWRSCASPRPRAAPCRTAC
jgi:hypothetical protein